MARQPRNTEGALERALDQVREAPDVEQLRAAQAVLLPLLGLSLEQAAEIIGKDRYWISRTRNRMLRGEAAPMRQGGRRHAVVSEDQELSLVKQAIEKQFEGYIGERTTVRSALRALLDLQTDHPVAESTITGMMNRTAPKILRGARGSDLEHVAFQLARAWFSERWVEYTMQRLGRR